MQDKAIRILCIEDNAGDARLLQEMLLDAGGDQVTLSQAPDLTQALARLQTESFDIILLDLGLPESRGLNTFSRVQEAHPELPIVVLSGLDDEAVAISAVQEGAQDYLVKKQISGGSLLRSIRYAIERHVARERAFTQMRRGGESGTIALVDAKGGVGVTTLALNFAASLASRGSSIIVIEMRGQHGTLSSLFSRAPLENISHVAELGASQISQQTLSPRLFKTAFGLRVLCGPQEAHEEFEITPEQAVAIVDAAAEMSDFTVLDIPAYAPEAAHEAMRRSWRTFLVLEPDPASIRAAKVTLDRLRIIGITGQLAGAIVVNRVAVPIGPTINDVRDQLGIEVYAAIPPAAEACVAAQRSGMPVVLAQPDGVYAAAVAEAVERLTAEQITARSAW